MHLGKLAIYTDSTPYKPYLPAKTCSNDDGDHSGSDGCSGRGGQKVEIVEIWERMKNVLVSVRQSEQVVITSVPELLYFSLLVASPIYRHYLHS